MNDPSAPYPIHEGFIQPEKNAIKRSACAQAAEQVAAPMRNALRLAAWGRAIGRVVERTAQSIQRNSSPSLTVKPDAWHNVTLEHTPRVWAMGSLHLTASRARLRPLALASSNHNSRFDDETPVLRGGAQL
jgi:hypothetical protein